MLQNENHDGVNHSRRLLLSQSVVLAAAPVIASAAAPSGSDGTAANGKRAGQTEGTILTKDGVTIHYKDWGAGPPVVLSHGWPLSSDSWEPQMFFLANQGFRVIAHDRRGHGRSSQPWTGNDMDHYADDLAQVMTALNLRNVVLVGFSTGGGEVTRYVGRHGTDRIAKLGLVSAVPPMMLKTADNPGGVPIEVFDQIRAGSIENRAQQYLDLASGPFYGFNRPGAKISQGLINAWWAEGMRAGARNTYDCIAAFSATDFRRDLEKFDKPTLIVHGEDDQIVPIDVGGRATAGRLKQAKLLVYPNAPHGLPQTHRERFNTDLLEFIRS